MTYNDIINIAKRLDKETQKRIDKDVEERVEILKEGDLSKEDMDKMEECLYMSLVLQEYLSGEYELLEEEKALLLAEMEEMFNEYGELLSKAKLEEKLSKKKRMALYLMKIREELFDKKERVKDVDERMKNNQNDQDKLKNDASKDNMKKIADNNKDKVMGKDKKDLPNPDKMKWGADNDSGRVTPSKGKEKEGNPSAGLSRDRSETTTTSDSDRRDAQRIIDKVEAFVDSHINDGRKIDVGQPIKEDISKQDSDRKPENDGSDLAPSGGADQASGSPLTSMINDGRFTPETPDAFKEGLEDMLDHQGGSLFDDNELGDVAEIMASKDFKSRG